MNREQDNEKEVVIGPYDKGQVSKILAALRDNASDFENEVLPLVVTLPNSYGYLRIIGIQSRDMNTRIRIDYEPPENGDKGVHFHFEELSRKNNPINICIKTFMTYEQYMKYIDRLNAGRFTEGSIEKIEKMLGFYEERCNQLKTVRPRVHLRRSKLDKLVKGFKLNKNMTYKEIVQNIEKNKKI